MSHLAKRKQNDCLNCGAVVYGRYCHLCGQENIEPKESFWHLVTHFIYDITHFDGKFFSSVKYLLLKPGFLPKEYIKGRRTRYLNPIRMHVFISAFFFLFFFVIIKPSFETDKKEETEKLSAAEVRTKIEKRTADLKQNAADKENPEFVKKLISNQISLLQQDLQTIAKDTSHLSDLNYFTVKGLSISFGNYHDLKQYDSVQNSLPAKERDKGLDRTFARKTIELQTKFNYNGQEFLEAFFEKFRHSFPQLLFVSLPVFALLLKLLYFKKARFYYADHVIFAVHLYSAMFILQFIILSISQIKHFKYFHWLQIFTVPLAIYAFWYQYKSLRNFYDQSRLKTIVKYLLLLIMSTVVMTLLFVIFLVFSVFNL